jgi:drug/metabolite transporter (DMT)-like permease
MTQHDPPGGAVGPARAGRSTPGVRGPRLSSRPDLTAVLVLSLCTAFWGASFVVAKPLVDRYDPLSVLALRFAIGTTTLWVLRPRAVGLLSPATRRRAATIGLLLGLAQVPHYFGVRESSASAAAFLIGTYVVVTPIFDRLLYGVRTTRTAMAGAVLALAGLALFAAGGTVSGAGLAICLTAAVLYAVQISTLGAWVPPDNLWGFTTVTMAAITVVVAIPAAVRGVEVPTSTPDWVRMLYLALVAGVAGVAMQAWAQRRVAATQAAVIMVMEPVWATAIAVTFTAESLSPQLVAGGAVLLVANLVVARGSRPGAVARPREGH